MHKNLQEQESDNLILWGWKRSQEQKCEKHLCAKINKNVKNAFLSGLENVTTCVLELILHINAIVSK